MIWIAPSGKDTDNAALGKGLSPLVPVWKDLAVHGLEGDIRHSGQVNSRYDDPHDATNRIDIVLANPPFNKTVLSLQR